MAGHILGDFNSQPRIGHPESYFIERDIWLDCREPDMITIDPSANLGWCINFVVQSHNPLPGMFGDVVARPIEIGPQVFIAAFSIIYNCKIGEGAIVALGSVVRSLIIPPWVMVEGNPARVIKVFKKNIGRWVDSHPELEFLNLHRRGR